jgi:DNA helicase-2/ATP-dependent DNA helicase PcrA
VQNVAADLTRELNEQQLEAVTHGEGPQLILAGAGSGKTRVITYRVAWLCKEVGIDPRSIVAVTFTNKAAGEMRERIEQLLGIYPLPTFVGTFHRFALGLLRRWGNRIAVPPGFSIFDRDDQISLIKKALKAEGLSDSSFPPRRMLAAIGSAKNQLMGPSEYEAQADGFFPMRVARVYRHYQGALVDSGAMDFDDMLRLSVKLLTEEPEVRDRLRDRIHYLLVDEFQDTNHAQMRMVTLLTGENGNLTAVGDEDQGIYRWRGADLSNVLQFERAFPNATIRKLERNYRSTQNILTAAGDLVSNNQNRRGKSLWTDAGEGEEIELYRARDEQDEASWVANTLQGLTSDGRSWKDMGVLVRTNAQTRAFEEQFLKREIPYELVGGTHFYDRAEIKDLVAYLRILRNPRDDLSFTRILNKPPRGIGKATQQLLEQRAAENSQSLWDALTGGELGSFPPRGAKALGGFRDMIRELQEEAKERPLPSLLELLLERTGYTKMYDKDDPEAYAKLENIQEFLTAAQEFTEERLQAGETDLLTAFLDHASLVSDIDLWREAGGVSIMTLHSAKGLEFPVVMVTGLEEGVLPHFNAGGAPEDLEEERRLLYVGMTRAREQLFLSHCRRRRVAGYYQDQEESRFLSELPADIVNVTRSPELFVDERSSGVHSFFGGERGGRRSGGGARPSSRRPLESQAFPGLKKGRRVRHPSLGDGVVLELDGDGPNGKLTVYFDRVGKRKLVAKYANLEVL